MTYTFSQAQRQYDNMEPNEGNPECKQCGCPRDGDEGQCIEPDCDANCLITCECGEINDTTYVSICTNTFCEEEI